MTDEFTHAPVLLNEVIAALNIKKEGNYIDGTFGRGGHASEVLKLLGPNGHLLGIDKDEEAVAEARRRFGNDTRFEIERGTFALIKQMAESRNWMGKVDGVLLDLGVSSPQIDDAQRGFSFKQDGPLDMRMNCDVGQSAAQWLAVADEKDITLVLKKYGEEKFARRIARAIVETRVETPLKTTGQLAKLIADASPSHEKHKDPATRSFQAIRIYINDELNELSHCLPDIVEILAKTGRLVVISFHSLEDRIVKRFMRDRSIGDDFPAGLPVTQAQLNPELRIIGRVIRAGEAEIAINQRARSAVLRVGEKL